MKYDIKKIKERIKTKKQIFKFIKKIIIVLMLLLFLINLIIGYCNYIEKNNKVIDKKIYFFTIVSRQYAT